LPERSADPIAIRCTKLKLSTRSPTATPWTGK
jgi:hypothetical protein